MDINHSNYRFGGSSPTIFRKQECFLSTGRNCLTRYEPDATPGKAQDVLELNQADSLALIRIKGIGPYYAHRILTYRKRLGGFHAVSQLKELNMIYFNADSSNTLLKANPALIRKKDFQTLTFKEILRHPYLEYEDVVLIFQAKKKYGTIAYDTLQKHRVLPTHKLRKIKPYFR